MCGGGGVSPAGDKKAAVKANLRPADLPAGWSDKPHDPLPAEDALIPDIASCLGRPASIGRFTVEERSADFTQSIATVSSVIRYARTQKEATADRVAFTGDRYGECAQPGYIKQMHDVAPEGNTVTDPTTARIALPTFGTGSADDRISALVHIPQLSTALPINIDVLRIFKGRAEAEITVVAPGEPFPTDFLTKTGRAIASRL